MRLKSAINFQVGQQHGMDERNTFWKFGKNPTMWRHVTSCDVIFKFRAKIAMTSSKIMTSLSNFRVQILIFPNLLWHTNKMRGQPFLSNNYMESCLHFNYCHILINCRQILMTSSWKKCWRQQNIDVISNYFIILDRSCVSQHNWKVWLSVRQY